MRGRKLDLEKGMMDCLYAKCTPCITNCVMVELEKLGQKCYVGLRCRFMNFSRDTRCLKCKAEGPKRVAMDDVQIKKGDWNCPGIGFSFTSFMFCAGRGRLYPCGPYTFCGKALNCIDIGGEGLALIAAGGSNPVLRIWDPCKLACKWHNTSPLHLLSSSYDGKLFYVLTGGKWKGKTNYTILQSKNNLQRAHND
ncbi:hypothetical protein J1N35_043539 [Gossypium stocksii]|uniref:Uncharacterized protein n=1 Tax=Gossypium stocksii TaxID=47602 RepID=A0A9D3U7U4_9ROSI|nr:hypothetical protein J1N35_043539 [Gossypium stocksii]